MDFKQIQELIKMINKSNIGEVTIEEKGFKLTIRQKEEPAQNVFASPVQAQPYPQQAQPQLASQSAGNTAPSSEKSKAASEAGRRGCAARAVGPRVCDHDEVVVG